MTITLFKFYLIVSGVIMQSLNSHMPYIQSVTDGRTERPILKKSFTFQKP